MRLSTWIAGLPTLAITIWFALANRSLITVSLDPFAGTTSPWTIDMPLFVIVFIGIFIGMLAGGTVVWWGQGRWRREAKTTRREVERLSTETTDNSNEGASK